MRRISWKRGMRLTDDILRASDECTSEFIGRALILAAGGRFGLLPSSRPFELTVNIGGNVIDVESLSCLAVTKGGLLIDVQYDTKYTNSHDTRVIIPEGINTQEFILTLNANPSQWIETQDGFEEPVYTFSLLASEMPVPDNALPIGRIVEDCGWRLDDVDFVPPCLLVSSHYKYVELLKRFSDLLATIDTKAQSYISSSGKNAIRIFWPVIQQLRIAVSKEIDMMTPMTLLSNVQKCVSAFTCACDLENSITLANDKMFKNYVLAPYNYQDAYVRIKVGLELCFSIAQMVENLESKKEEPKAPRQEKLKAPFIDEDQLFQNCKKRDVSIPVILPTPKAKVFYSTDGSEPSRALPAHGKIIVSNNFNKRKVAEQDQELTVKLKAVMNGTSSDTATYVITLHKDYKDWDGYTI